MITPTTEIYPLSLHDALPISFFRVGEGSHEVVEIGATGTGSELPDAVGGIGAAIRHLAREALVEMVVAIQDDLGARRLERSEEHTSELQSQSNLVFRLLLEKK